jgi:hypothetical protein
MSSATALDRLANDRSNNDNQDTYFSSGPKVSRGVPPSQFGGHGVETRLTKPGRVRRGPRVELLELRSLLSVLPSTPDTANLVVDGQETSVMAHDESAASVLTISAEGQPNWITGIIGDSRRLPAPSADVDVFQLELPGSERYAVRLDLLAHRFGGELDGAVSVFDSDGELIATNDDGLGEFPSDAILNLGLDGGTYFIAVSEGGNVPGSDGFDLNVPGSGSPGRESTGRYVLRVMAEPDSQPPRVTGISFEPGQTFDSPLTHIIVQFSEPMDPAGLVSGASLTSESGDGVGLAAIEYDHGTNAVTYLVLDRPTAGDWQFTFDAAAVTDWAGHTLDAGTDFSAAFRVDAAAPTLVDQEPNDSHDAAQDLGNLFPAELAEGVGLSGSLSASDVDVVSDGDFYRFRVSVPGLYLIRLHVPADVTRVPDQFRLLDASGNPIAERTVPAGTQVTMYRNLAAGEYVLEIAGGGDATDAYDATVQSVLGVLGFAEIIPLTASDFAGSVQIVIRPGVAPVASTASEPAESTIVAPTRDVAQAAAVQSLPAVASEPAGRPGVASADPTALAWVDQSGGAAKFPVGFVLPGRSTGESVRVSVDGVSGSFLDPLATSLPAGTHALSPSASLIVELAQLVRETAQGESSVVVPSDTAPVDDALMVAAEETADDPHLALSPQALTITIVATLGAAGAMTSAGGRRESDWLTNILGLAPCGA